MVSLNSEISEIYLENKLRILQESWNYWKACWRNSSLLVGRIRSRPGVHELLDDGGVAADGRVVQRGHAELVGAVRIGVEVDENLRRNVLKFEPVRYHAICKIILLVVWLGVLSESRLKEVSSIKSLLRQKILLT